MYVARSVCEGASDRSIPSSPSLGPLRQCAPLYVPCVCGLHPGLWGLHTDDEVRGASWKEAWRSLTGALFCREILYSKDAQPFLIAGSGTLGWDQVCFVGL